LSPKQTVSATNAVQRSSHAAVACPSLDREMRWIFRHIIC